MNNNTEDMSMKELLENTDKVNYSDILAEINPEFNGKDTDKIIEEIVNSNDTESVEKFVVFMEKYEEDIGSIGKPYYGACNGNDNVCSKHYD